MAELNTACLYDVAYALSDPKRPISDLYDEMLATNHIAIRTTQVSAFRIRLLRQPHGT